MKKVIALFAVMMLIPMTAFGMQSMDQQEMSEVTGQSGVAITIDDVVLHESASETWYQNSFDTDGNATNGYEATGAVGMVEEGAKTTYVNAITGAGATADGLDLTGTAGTYELQGDYAGNLGDTFVTAVNNGNWSPSPLTIQVGQFGVLGSGGDSAFVAANSALSDATGVVVGLPTVEIHEEGGMATKLLVSNSPNPLNDERADSGVSSFGTLYTGESTMAILDGRIEIAPVNEVH